MRFSSEIEAQRHVAHNGWRVIETVYVMRGVRINVVEAGRPRTCRIDHERCAANAPLKERAA